MGEGGNLGKEAGEALGLLGCVNEVVAAVAATWGPMTDGARVEAAPRLAQWRVDALPCYTYRKSLPFRIGLWNWSVPSPAPCWLLLPSLPLSMPLFSADHC